MGTCPTSCEPRESSSSHTGYLILARKSSSLHQLVLWPAMMWLRLSPQSESHFALDSTLFPLMSTIFSSLVQTHVSVTGHSDVTSPSIYNTFGKVFICTSLSGWIEPIYSKVRLVDFLSTMNTVLFHPQVLSVMGVILSDSFSPFSCSQLKQNLKPLISDRFCHIPTCWIVPPFRIALLKPRARWDEWSRQAK